MTVVLVELLAEGEACQGTVSMVELLAEREACRGTVFDVELLAEGAISHILKSKHTL